MAMDLSQKITLACLLEATAPKVGNVHRGADFADMSFTDFVYSATLVCPIIASASTVGVGESIYRAAEATASCVGANTNLGILLLLGPLAAVPAEQPIREGVESPHRLRRPRMCSCESGYQA